MPQGARLGMAAEAAGIAPGLSEGKVRVRHDLAWQIRAQVCIHAAVHAFINCACLSCKRNICYGVRPLMIAIVQSTLQAA